MAIASRPTMLRNESDSFIARLREYAPLGEEEVAGFRELVERQIAIPRKQDVILEGYESRKLHVVKRGFAARYKLLPSGRRQVIRLVLPGDMIGMPSSFFRTAPYSVTSLSDMTLQQVALKGLADLCLRLPQLAVALLWYSQRELAHHIDQLVDVGRRSPLERVAHFLLELHSRLQAVGGATARGFEMPVSQEVIGDLLSLSAPHVNRMLHQLRNEGFISLGRRRVVFENLEDLKLLAQFEPISPSPLVAGRE